VGKSRFAFVRIKKCMQVMIITLTLSTTIIIIRRRRRKQIIQINNKIIDK
jgi:hypothetical protein